MSYRGRAFWTRDSVAELWLCLMRREIDRMADRPDWLRDARSHWYLHATVGFQGCVSPEFDELLGTDHDRVDLVLTLAQQVRDRLAEFAPAIPKDVANTFDIAGEGSYFPGDVPTGPLLDAADAFLALLRGELAHTGPNWPMIP